MSANPHTAAGHAGPREFTLAEVDQLGRSLAPVFGRVVDQAVEPLRLEIAALKTRASIWGAVTGALTSLGAIALGRWHS